MERIAAARDLIRQQALALDTLAAELDEAFELALALIFDHVGKVVVTGMGKAGLIGAKISATLRSTGQPSVFLDPAQALHGDMGMIGPSDVLLALSNSGETDEVLAVMRYCAEHKIGVVGITGSDRSPVALESNATILYPRMPEGCPIGRAPMASAMMMLAIGDALAAALMVARGFTTADFLRLHHGGYLGRLAAVA